MGRGSGVVNEQGHPLPRGGMLYGTSGRRAFIELTVITADHIREAFIQGSAPGFDIAATGGRFVAMSERFLEERTPEAFFEALGESRTGFTRHADRYQIQVYRMLVAKRLARGGMFTSALRVATFLDEELGTGIRHTAFTKALDQVRNSDATLVVSPARTAMTYAMFERLLRRDIAIRTENYLTKHLAKHGPRATQLMTKVRLRGLIHRLLEVAEADPNHLADEFAKQVQ
jgi:hypothetical protein